jgi:hypothetical protein
MSALQHRSLLDRRVNKQRAPVRTEVARRQSTPMTTGPASLCALGESRRRPCGFAPLRGQVTMAQKVVKYRPIETRLDGLLGMLCGAKTIAQSHVTISVGPAVQRAFGRQGCAEPSTMARTLQACTAENVAPWERVAWDYLKRSGVTPRPPRHAELWWVDADGTPMSTGAKAEGSERAWLGRSRRKTGRNTRRCTASADREIRHETLQRGNASAMPALKAARPALAASLSWTREVWQRIVIRRNGGLGTTAVRHGLRSRGAQVVAQISRSERVWGGRPQVGPGPPTSRRGREMAEGVAPRRCCRPPPTPDVIRTVKDKGGDQDAVLVTTLAARSPAELADREDGRAMIEAPCGPDQPGLGLGTRRQHTWEAQPRGVRWARLAHHRLLWRQRWLSRVPTTRWRWRQDGGGRRRQDVWTVPGGIRWRNGWLVSTRFAPLHPQAQGLQQRCAALFGGRVRGRCWRENLTAGITSWTSWWRCRRRI